jgi:hypothetical protein
MPKHDVANQGRGHAVIARGSSARHPERTIRRRSRGWLTFCEPFGQFRTLAYSRPVRKIELGLFLVALAGAVGCGGTPTAPSEDETFYLHQRGVIDKRYSWERYFPPLDRDATPLLQRRVGVALFDGTVRLSRPIDWYLRTADNTPSGRLISYQSPRQFLFSIYERTDPEGDTWTDVLKRYEDQVQKDGAKIVAGRIPVATANA